MDYEQKSKLLNRIFAGHFYVETDLHDLPFVLFKHPDLASKMRADYIYDLSFKTAIVKGALKEQEAIDVSIQQKIWSKFEECNIDNFKQYLNKLAKDINKNKLNTPLLDTLKKKQADCQLKLGKLQIKRNTITSITAEKYAITRKHEFVIREITYCADQPQTKLFDLPVVYNFNITALIEKLATLYFIENQITAAQIRELARSHPWRLYYSPAKTIHYNIFNRPPADYSEEQISLLYWSSIYDYVNESTERPDEYIINNDELLDKWLEAQDEKNKKEASKYKSNVNISSHRSGPGLTEVFIPCSPDKVDEVEKMNSPVARAAKQKMFQRLNERGTLNEFQHGAIFHGVI